MQKIAIYGKGGIGKSTISSSLSVNFAKKDLKVLHMGCDPKKDSTMRILNGKKITTVLEIDRVKFDERDFLVKGVLDIDCIECGGPKAGVGCAGRGISRTFEILEKLDTLNKREYDVALFDVLGDVVCGGFAAPLRRGFGEKVFIVISEEIMSLYAANNIIHAIKTYESNNIYFGGLILNLRNNKADLSNVKKFLKLTNTNIIGIVPRSSEILKAEKSNKTVVELYPESKTSEIFDKLSDKVLNITKNKSYNPIHIDDDEFSRIFIQ